MNAKETIIAVRNFMKDVLERTKSSPSTGIAGGDFVEGPRLVAEQLKEEPKEEEVVLWRCHTPKEKVD